MGSLLPDSRQLREQVQFRVQVWAPAPFLVQAEALPLLLQAQAAPPEQAPVRIQPEVVPALLVQQAPPLGLVVQALRAQQALLALPVQVLAAVAAALLEAQACWADERAQAEAAVRHTAPRR